MEPDEQTSQVDRTDIHVLLKDEQDHDQAVMNHRRMLQKHHDDMMNHYYWLHELYSNLMTHRERLHGDNHYLQEYHQPLQVHHRMVDEHLIMLQKGDSLRL